MKKHLPAIVDRNVWIITSAVVALAVILLVAAGIVPSKFLVADLILYGLAAIVLAIIGISLLARPVRYDVRDDSLTIVRYRPFADITFPKSAIKEIRHVKLGEIKPVSLAIFGVFGYVGRFKSEEQGSIVMIATNPEHAVLIVTDNRYIITPSNPKRFLHDMSGKK